MKKYTLIICFLLLVAIPASRVFAQESIMNDISYPQLDKLIAAAKQNYPMIKINRERALIAQNSYKQTKKSWFDLLSFSYIYSPQTNINLAAANVFASIFQGYQVAISLNVGTIFEKPLVIKNAHEAYNIALLEQQDYELTLELEVKTRYFNYLRELGLVRLRSRTSLDAENVISLAKHQFEQGTETTDNYIRAEVTFAENNQAKIDAEAAVLIAKASLEQIIGKKLEEIK